MTDETLDHRRHLLEALHAASQDFDRAIMTLSAGALGVSIAFVRDIAVNPSALCLLRSSWILFTLSLLLILISFITSQEALRFEIEKLGQTATEARPGGGFGVATLWLNITSGLSLVAGVVCLVWFALVNV